MVFFCSMEMHRENYVLSFMSASSVSIFALLTDMADVDELITSLNRPGTVSGMATFVRKIGAGLVSALIGILLTMVGYSGALAGAGQLQSAATQQGITMYVGSKLVQKMDQSFFMKLTYVLLLLSGLSLLIK